MPQSTPFHVGCILSINAKTRDSIPEVHDATTSTRKFAGALTHVVVVLCMNRVSDRTAHEAVAIRMRHSNGRNSVSDRTRVLAKLRIIARLARLGLGLGLGG